jgi:plasmid stabilization system protein ParE
VLKLIWRETALDDLDNILEYVHSNNPAAAVRLQALFEDRAERLAEHPYMSAQAGFPVPARPLFIPTTSWFT